ncbi:MAG: hypothetical protein AAFX99_25735, partial [Myxococcota bacterium]
PAHPLHGSNSGPLLLSPSTPTIAMRVHRRLKSDLAEHPSDPQMLARAIAQRRQNVTLARTQLGTQPDDTTARGILARELKALGDLLTLSRDLDEAETLLRESIDHWIGLKRTKAKVLTQLKLVTALRLQRRFSEALDLVERLAERSRDEPDLHVYMPFILVERGIVYHHMARPRLADQDLNVARERFALQGARRQMEQTDQVLDFIKKKEGGPPPH